MRTSISLSLLLAASSIARGQEPPTDDLARARAQALLKLAELQRSKAPSAPPACMGDMALAATIAAKEGKPLLIWVGGCDGAAALRNGLPDCVHCHTSAYNGDATPRLIVPSPIGPRYWTRPELPGVTPQMVRDLVQGNVSFEQPTTYFAPTVGGGECRS
jgi:hypothetical protein